METSHQMGRLLIEIIYNTYKNFLKKIKMKIIKRYDALVSNKAPKPTTFSNRRFAEPPDSPISSKYSTPGSPSRARSTPTEGCRINLENIVSLEDKI